MADAPAETLLLKRALAQYLHDRQLAVYRPSTPYVNTERAIYTNGVIPTTIDNCVVMTARRPIADGRANMVYPIQLFGRVKGTPVDAENFAWALTMALDQKENVPPGRLISWSWLFSQADFGTDKNTAGQERASFAQTFYFRGRRPQTP